jgi:general secretion pathway protein I
MSGNRAHGFSLLEVVVALAIAAVALVGLFRAGSDGLFAADTASHTEEALQRAQSHLAAVGRDVALLPGDFEGDDGGGFRWRLQVHPAAVRQAPTLDAGSAAPLTLFDVEVAISWPSRGRDRTVALKTRRLGSTAGSE